MFEIIKTIIPKLANEAVLKAEENLKGENGEIKKAAAIKFVVEHLPIKSSFKYIFGYFFGMFIDLAIEAAVAFMKQYREETLTED